MGRSRAMRGLMVVLGMWDIEMEMAGMGMEMAMAMAAWALRDRRDVLGRGG